MRRNISINTHEHKLSKIAEDLVSAPASQTFVVLFMLNNDKWKKEQDAQVFGDVCFFTN